MSFIPLLLLLVGQCLEGSSFLSPAPDRTRTNFDFGWRFHLGNPRTLSSYESWDVGFNPSDTNAGLKNCSAGTPCDPAYDDTAWREVAVPHDFVVEGTFNKSLNPNHGALATNVSWYVTSKPFVLRCNTIEREKA